MSNKEKKGWLKRMWKKISSLPALVLLVVGGLGGIIFWGGFNTALEMTNTMEFCTSCHTMKVNLEEYKETAHYKNTSGVQATCSDCHVPKPFFPKMKAKILAYKDVMHEILGTIDTPEKYEAHRWDMASRVWDKMRATDSRECRNCHSFDNMDLSEQDRTARKKHSKAVDKGKTCIDCHTGLAHELPDEPEDEEAEDAPEDNSE